MSVDFSPDGQTVVTSSADIRFWKTTSKPEVETLTSSLDSTHLDYSPDGRLLVMKESGTNQVTLWDTATKKFTLSLPGKDFAYSPDGRVLALIQETNVTIYATEDVRLVGTIRSKTPLSGPAVISPDGKLLALRNQGQHPVLLDLHEMVLIATLDSGPNGRPEAWLGRDRMVFTLDSRILIEGDSSDGEIRLWDTSNAKLVGRLRGHQTYARTLAISPDGLMLASASESTIRFWNLATRAAADNPVLTVNNGDIGALAFSPDGKTLAIGCFDGPIKLWSVHQRQEVATLKAHLSFIQSLAFSPDGRTLASSSYDNTVRLWSAPTLQEIDAAR
jgi:WD40 repeat protein